MDRTLVRILLVEDNPADALLLRDSLSSDLLTDFQVTVAERLRQGLEELGARPYDVVLLDLGLPDSQGLETFEAAHAEFPNIPMIVLSGMSDELLALQAVQSGAQDYLVKGEASWSFGARSIRYAIERHQSQLAMRASEARFSTVFHSSPTSIAITRISDNKLVEVNEAWEQTTGYSSAEVVGRVISEFNLWEHPEEREQIVNMLRSDGVAHGIEFQMRRKSGQLACMLFSAELIEVAGEACMLSMALDITERKQVEKALKDSEEKFRNFIEQSTDGLMIADEQGIVIESNHALEKINEIPREQALGMAVWDIQSQMMLSENRSPDNLDVFRMHIQTAVQNGQSPYFGRTYEAAIQTKSGERKIIQQASFPIKTEKGYRIGAIIRDVTERKQVDDKLRKLSRAMEQSPTSIVITDLLGNIEYVNPKFSQVTGYTLQEAIGQNPRILKSGFTLQEEYEKMWDTITSGDVWQGEFLNRKKDGETYWELATIAPIFSDDGKITNFLAMKEDITEQKQAEEKIVRAEKRFKSLIERAPDGVVLVGRDLGFAYVSPSARKIFGYDINDSLDITPNGSTHPEDLPLVLEVLNRLIQDPSQSPMLQYRFRHKGGSWLWIESTFTNLLAEPSVEAIVINFRDITERKLANEKLRESEERLRLAYDAAELGSWQEDLLTHIFTLDERARRHYDQDGEHPSAAEVASRVHPEDASRLRVAIGAVLVPQSGGRFEIEYRVIHRDGSIHWLQVHSRVHFEDRNGERVAVLAVGTSQDITERKNAEAELARRNRQLRLIHEATHRLNVSLDAGYIHEVIYTNVRQLMPCDTLFISAFDPASGMISMAGGWHDDRPVDVTAYGPIPLEPQGSGIQSQVIRTKTPESIPDFQARLKTVQVVHHFDGDGQAVDELPEEEDIPRSALVVPLLTEGNVLGVIQVFSYRLNAYTEDDLQILTGFSAQAAIALSNARLYENIQQENIERRRAEASLRTRTRQLEALFNISDHLGSVQTEQQSLSVVMAELESLMGAHAGGIVLVEADRQHLILARAEHALTQNLGRRFPIGDGICGKVLREGQAYLTDDFAGDPLRLQDVVDFESLGPALFAPIRAESEFIGALVVMRMKDPHSQPFDADAVRMLTAVGEIMGSTLQRVRLFEQTSSQLSQLQILHKMDRAITGSLDLGLTLRLLLTEVTSQPEVDAAAILLVNPHSLTLEYAASSGFRTRAIEQMRLMIGQGYAGLAALRREILQVRDLQNCDEPLRRQIFKEEGFKTYTATPLIAKGKIVGVLEFYAHSILDYGPDWDNFIETLANQATIAIENARLFTDLQRSNLQMELAFDATIEGWARAVELHAHETEGHSVRVVDIALDLAQVLGMSNDEMIQLRRGALLHDIGKLAVPDTILLKPGPLTPEDWDVVRRHPLVAYEILQAIEYLHGALAVPYCHHEKWDGSGYPRGLAGEQIPLMARIFAVADVYEVLTSNRPYRSAWEHGKALAYIEEQSGKHFDPRVVEVFRTWYRTR
ncbi:MAG: PAS domain S-box protein [Chloroflexi bacterium]|nr:PAS domain S-box protein [Chloroflexota bacterium]